MTSESSAATASSSPASESSGSQSFKDFKLNGHVLEAIREAGFNQPSPIQCRAIPAILAQKDLIAQAQTGSGKTAAFVIPTLHKLLGEAASSCLVLVPTRELCQQVVREFKRLAGASGIRILGITGGESYTRQIRGINEGAQVVVATPGRLLDHLQGGKLDEFFPDLVVLDEADEMLDMGFIEDIQAILSHTSEQRQTLLFSATMPPAVLRLARKELKNPESITLVNAKESHQDIQQVVYPVRAGERTQALIRLMEAESPHKAVVFCRTRRDTSELCEELVKAGIKALSLHGDLSQGERTRAIGQIKGDRCQVLVATDVASRGLDIQDLSHVFNYHVPENRERYTHRIGRTGRAGRKGKALTLATPMELRSNGFLKQGGAVEYATVPTRQQTRRLQKDRLLERINSTPVSERAVGDLEMLTEFAECLEFAQRVYSMLQSQHQVSGPEKLGIEPSELFQRSPGGRPKEGSSKFARNRRRRPSPGKGWSGKPGGKPGRFKEKKRAKRAT